MAVILGGVTGPPATLQPIIYTSPCKANQKHSTKGKYFPKYANKAKTQRVPQPSPPCETMGV